MEVRAKFPMVTTDCDEQEFIARLADWCGQYVDEISIPVMVCAHELYEDPAIRHLVYAWWDEWREDKATRRRYFEQMADYDRKVPPFRQEWHRDKQRALNEALTALLVR